MHRIENNLKNLIIISLLLNTNKYGIIFGYSYLVILCLSHFELFCGLFVLVFYFAICLRDLLPSHLVLSEKLLFYLLVRLRHVVQLCLAVIVRVACVEQMIEINRHFVVCLIDFIDFTLLVIIGVQVQKLPLAEHLCLVVRIVFDQIVHQLPDVFLTFLVIF